MDQRLNLVLKNLGLSPTEAEVYRALLSNSRSVKEIQSHTGIKRPTVYYALGQLEQMGLVAKAYEAESCRYVVEPIQKLESLLSSRQKDLEELTVLTKEIIRNFESEGPLGDNSIVHYSTLKSVRQAVLFTLYSKEKKVISIVPRKNFFEDSPKEFKRRYVIEKQKRGVTTRALWEKIPEQEIIEEHYNDITFKKLPACMRNQFETVVFMYDDKTLYVHPSTKKPSAVLVKSEDHAKLNKAMFETLWRSA